MVNRNRSTRCREPDTNRSPPVLLLVRFGPAYPGTFTDAIGFRTSGAPFDESASNEQTRKRTTGFRTKPGGRRPSRLIIIAAPRVEDDDNGPANMYGTVVRSRRDRWTNVNETRQRFGDKRARGKRSFSFCRRVFWRGNQEITSRRCVSREDIGNKRPGRIKVDYRRIV